MRWAMDIGKVSIFNNVAMSLSMCLLPCRSSPFLCLSTAQVWLRGDSVDAMPFVAFLVGNTYRTKDDFLDAVSSGGQPAEFLSFALSLRLNRHTCPTLRQLKLLRSGKRTARWFGPAAQEAYNLYRLMLLRCRPCADLFRHDEEVAPTRSVRRKLARSGLCAPGAPSLATRAQHCAAALWACMKGAIFVLWFDNFYRRQFHPTPHESDTSLNCTAIVVAPVSKAIEFCGVFHPFSHHKLLLPKWASC